MDYTTSFIEMYEDQHETGRQFDADNVENFLNWPEYSFWRGFLQVTNDTNRP